MRVIVVGTGIAGLIAAFRASARHEVVLVTKAELAESNTKYAQGGIAAVLSEDDTVASHVDDTLRAGAGLCDRAAVEVLCAEGPERVRDLMALGVEFDRDADGALARGNEAAHSQRRVLHAGGDATGLAIEVALLRAVRAVAADVHEHTFMRDLVVEGEGAERRVVGIDVVRADGSEDRLDADAVILASGGAGQLYLHTTNPRVTTGDGAAAAWRAGAQLADVEFMQFHPTALAVAGSPLISEAVRGEGAVLLDAAGERFMLAEHPAGELAPRDVVARGIAAAMARQNGEPVRLDATVIEREQGEGSLARRFPTLTRVTLEHGIDWTRETVPVTPAAHYWMGGIRTDLDGRTSLPGLYAIGEAACTGVHGANRLASNSLLESLVFAWRVVDALGTPHPDEFDDARIVHAVVPDPDVVGRAGAERPTREQIRALMWSAVGLTRDAAGLRSALSTLAGWHIDGGDVAALEERNLLDLARLVTHAALVREESRGAHARTDAPDSLDHWQHALAWTHPAFILEGAVR